ncbi:hypothetical protein ACWIUD_01355 [Helicobacter sp. 23-1044]
MKKLVLCAVCVILGASEVNISKSFIQSGVVKPALLYANIRIESSAKLRNIGELKEKDRGAITTALNAIIQEAKKSEICTGGSYSINPIISYKNEARNTIGQSVDFSLNCKFTNESLGEYNALLKNINDKIKQNPLLSLPQPQVQSQITQIEINAKKERLFEDFLAKSSEISAHYSQILRKKCGVAKISTNDIATIQKPRLLMAKSALNASAEADTTHTKAPISDEVEVEIVINLVLNCKDEA